MISRSSKSVENYACSYCCSKYCRRYFTRKKNFLPWRSSKLAAKEEKLVHPPLISASRWACTFVRWNSYHPIFSNAYTADTQIFSNRSKQFKTQGNAFHDINVNNLINFKNYRINFLLFLNAKTHELILSIIFWLFKQHIMYDSRFAETLNIR